MPEECPSDMDFFFIVSIYIYNPHKIHWFLIKFIVKRNDKILKRESESHTNGSATANIYEPKTHKILLKMIRFGFHFPNIWREWLLWRRHFVLAFFDFIASFRQILSIFTICHSSRDRRWAWWWLFFLFRILYQQNKIYLLHFITFRMYNNHPPRL